MNNSDFECPAIKPDVCCGIADVFRSRSGSILLLCRVTLDLSLWRLRVCFELVMYQMSRCHDTRGIDFTVVFSS